MNKLSRKKIFINESRVWNMKMNWRKNDSGKDLSRLSFLISCLFDERKFKQFLKMSGTEHDFTSMTNKEKNDFLGKLTKSTHVHEKIYFGNTDSFYSELHVGSVVLINTLSNTILRFTDRLQRLFVPRFYRDRRNTTSFLKRLRYVGEKKEIDEKYFSEQGTGLGRKLYEYRIGGDISRPVIFKDKDMDWPFPEKIYESIGFTVHGFSFEFKNVANNLSTILNPEDNLINKESNLEEVQNKITEDIFCPQKKDIEDKIIEYNDIPTKNFINESYFLYDKSNLIKKTFVTAINKQLSLYGSFSYFSAKTSATNLKLITSSEFLKFLIEKRSLKDNLKLQIAHVNGSEAKTSDKKIHDFSITRLGKRKKNTMPEPIETVIIRAQQDFDVVGGLNPIQIQISDDTVLNTLKKYKNGAYKITPLGMLFPATITKDTNLIFVTANNLSRVKKAY